MNRFRLFLSALWLALALVAGQQAAALHALSHATDQVSQKQDSKPASACDQCALYSQLTGPATTATPSVPLLDGAVITLAFEAERTRSPALLAYRSRAPPIAS